MSRAASSSSHSAANKCTCSVKGAVGGGFNDTNCVEVGGFAGGNKEVFVNAGYVYPSPNLSTMASGGFGGNGGKPVSHMMPVYSQWNNRLITAAAVNGGNNRFVEPDTRSLHTDNSGIRNISNGNRRLPMPNNNNNVIVNPLPPLPFSQEVVDFHQIQTPNKDISSDLNSNSKIQNLPNHLNPNESQVVMYKSDDFKADSEEELNTSSDPIYQEIGMAVKHKINNNDKSTNEKEEHELEDSSVGSNNLTGQNPGKTGQKKEIEYWQITAKEVVKFRPCTETFINRNNV